MDAVDTLIKALERRAEQARRVKEVLADDPALAEKLVRIIVESSNGPEPARPKRAPRRQAGQPTTWHKIREYFNARKNRWATVDEIAHAICVAPGSVRSVIYTTRADKFQGRRHPHRKGAKQWRLQQAGEA